LHRIKNYFSGDSVDPEFDHVLPAWVIDGLTCSQCYKNFLVTNKLVWFEKKQKALDLKQFVTGKLF